MIDRLQLLGMLLPLLASPTAAQAEQGGGASPARADERSALERATPMTREVWERLCAASLGGGAPITAFRLEAHTKIRDGANKNEADVAYGYLAPDCIRFRLSKERELGRFGKRKSDYWLREGDEVVWLKTRQYTSDRDSIREMAVLARNYIALSDPARLRIDAIELLRRGPGEARQAVGARRLNKLTWLSITSPDFALFGAEDAGGDGDEERYRVDFGLRPDTEEFAWAPEVAIVRTLPRPDDPFGGGERAVLFRLFSYREQDGFRIPFEVAVHHRDGSLPGAPFGRVPAQEVWIQKADLRPKLTVDDFRP